jgi:hypothetical protein
MFLLSLVFEYLNSYTLTDHVSIVPSLVHQCGRSVAAVRSFYLHYLVNLAASPLVKHSLSAIFLDPGIVGESRLSFCLVG